MKEGKLSTFNLQGLILASNSWNKNIVLLPFENVLRNLNTVHVSQSDSVQSIRSDNRGSERRQRAESLLHRRDNTLIQLPTEKEGLVSLQTKFCWNTQDSLQSATRLFSLFHII